MSLIEELRQQSWPWMVATLTNTWSESTVGVANVRDFPYYATFASLVLTEPLLNLARSVMVLRWRPWGNQLSKTPSTVMPLSDSPVSSNHIKFPRKSRGRQEQAKKKLDENWVFRWVRCKGDAMMLSKSTQDRHTRSRDDHQLLVSSSYLPLRNRQKRIEQGKEEHSLRLYQGLIFPCAEKALTLALNQTIFLFL